MNLMYPGGADTQGLLLGHYMLPSVMPHGLLHRKAEIMWLPPAGIQEQGTLLTLPFETIEKWTRYMKWQIS